MTNIAADADLQASEQRYRRLFETARDGILLLDAETGVLVEANPYMSEITGYSRDELLGKFIWDLGFLRNVAESKEKFLELQQEDYVRYEDLPLETKAGKTLHVEFVSNAYLVSSVRVIQCNIRDISARVHAEEATLNLRQMYRTVSRCNAALVHAVDEPGLHAEMCRVLIDEGHFRQAWVGYSQPGGDKFIQPMAAANAEGGYLAALKEIYATGLKEPGPVATAIKTGQTTISQDLRNDKPYGVERDQALQHGCMSCVAMPIHLDQTAPGILVIYGDKTDQFTDDVMLVLNELVGDLAFGINHLRAQEKALHTLQELDHSLDQAITAIASMVEMRDPYTAGHQRRVATLATAIAIEMGLPQDRVEGLRMASVVHDIGKIQVPAEILAKPGKLSAAEYDIIKSHPLAAWEVLKFIAFPWPVAEIVFQHHEKIDGSGYPRGLKGDEILLEARILTVADEVEAMASHRPYRSGLGIFAALQEISRQKGKTLDTDVVDACMRLFMNKSFELQIPEAS
jgi:PAS domain S-box-containing protein